MIDNKAKDAVKQVKNLSRSFQAVIDLANLIDDVNTIANSVQESERNLADKGEELKALQSDIDTAKADLEAARTAKIKANDEAALIKESAQAKALGIIHDANVQSGGIVSQANSQAKRITADAEALLVKLNGEVKIAKGELDTLNDKKVAAELEVKAVEGKLSIAREKLKEFLGE